MVYDPNHGVIVLFGGIHSNEYFSDTWLLFRTGWKRLD
jgi:hypothetical protein